MKKQNYASAALCTTMLVFVTVRMASKPSKEPPVTAVAALPPPPRETVQPLPEVPASPEELPPEISPKQETADEDVSREDKLTTELKEDKAFSSVAEVETISCSGSKCEIHAEAKGEGNDAVLMGVIQFLQTHPDFGTSFKKEDVKDNPKAALITVSQEKL